MVSNGRLFMTGSTVSNNTTDAETTDADVTVEAKSGGIQSASFYTGFNASVLNLSTITTTAPPPPAPAARRFRRVALECW